MCTVCNKSFTFQQSYHKHLLYHNDDKPYSCCDCGRAFKELSTLHNHQRIHTGEKPFSCEHCGMPTVAFILCMHCFSALNAKIFMSVIFYYSLLVSVVNFRFVLISNCIQL